MVLTRLAEVTASLTDALRLQLEALSIVRDLGHRNDVAGWLSSAGAIYMYLGEMQTAETYIQEGLALSKEIGARWSERWAYCHFGRLANLRGDHDGVLRAERQALSLCAQGFGNAWNVRFSVEELAHRAVAAGDWPRAARLMGAVGAFNARAGCSRDPLGRLEKSLAAVREHMGDAAVAAAWAEGQAMSIEQAGLRELKEMDEAMA
jgi:tetratricopeptide (TPR) repeat protein